MKYLIVGLGNKGEEYAETRHNIGFKVADKIAQTLEAPFKSANFGWISEGKYKGRKVFVLKPDLHVFFANELRGNILLCNVYSYIIVKIKLHIVYRIRRVWCRRRLA